MKLTTVIGILLLFMVACQKEDDRKPTGKLKIELGVFITVHEENGSLKSTEAAEDFKVIVYNAAGAEMISFEKASEMPEEVELETGDYYVAAHSNNDLPAAFENPYYYGRSEVFSILPNREQSVAITCELANTIVSIVYSDNIKSHFSGYTTTVAAPLGSLVFGESETRFGYFRPQPLTITAMLTWLQSDGTSRQKTLTGNIPSPQPKRRYEIYVDASAGGGSALFQINLGDSSIAVETVTITDEASDTTRIQPGDLLITEIMYNPEALADATGEWFEVYNNTGHSLSLQDLVISKNGTENHSISNPLLMAPRTYYVFARTDNAVTGNKYVYGTGISLNNTGAVLSLSTPGADSTRICSVDYGAEGFPNGTGASICLDVSQMNPLNADEGTSWCVSSSVFETGDLGTPGNANDDCSQ
jgi:hypothetical protein